jgi:hypothetical protein
MTNIDQSSYYTYCAMWFSNIKILNMTVMLLRFVLQQSATLAVTARKTKH